MMTRLGPNNSTTVPRHATCPARKKAEGMWPRCCVAARALGPASGTRGFRQVSAKKKVATKKQADASGRDPYALFKAAMTAEPDADALAQLPTGHREEHEAARGERSRRMMEQHKRVNGHLARLIRMREQERCPAIPRRHGQRPTGPPPNSARRRSTRSPPSCRTTRGGQTSRSFLPTAASSPTRAPRPAPPCAQWHAYGSFYFFDLTLRWDGMLAGRPSRILRRRCDRGAATSTRGAQAQLAPARLLCGSPRLLFFFMTRAACVSA